MDVVDAEYISVMVVNGFVGSKVTGAVKVVEVDVVEEVSILVEVTLNIGIGSVKR